MKKGSITANVLPVILLLLTLTLQGLILIQFNDVRGQEPGNFKPLAGASVSASGPGYGAAVTDSEGFYRISEGLYTGSYEVTAEAKGYISETVEGVKVEEGRETSDVDFYLKLSGVIAGRILDAETGKPIQGAQVVAVERRGNVTLCTSISDEHGRYRLDTNLDTGVYRVQALAKGYMIGFTDEVSVSAGEATLGVDVELQKSAVVEGTVREKDTGKPVGGAMVIAVSASGRYYGSAVSDGTGYYRMDTNLGGDRYNVTVVLAKGYVHSDPVEVYVEQAGSVTVDFDLKKSGVVKGRVLNSETGEPIANATVMLIPSTLQEELPLPTMATTDEQGRYEIDTNLDTGVYNATAFKPGFIPDPERTPTPLQVEVVAEEETSVDFYLMKLPSAVIAGKVVDEKGSPIAGALVTASLKEAAIPGIPGGFPGIPQIPGIPGLVGLGQAYTGADGSYRIDVGLTIPGTYIVSVKAEGFKPQNKTVTITDITEIKTVDFTLERFVSGVISGRVYGYLPVKKEAALTLEVTPTILTLGEEAEIKGVLKDAKTGEGLGGREVAILYSTTGEDWKVVAKVETDAEGRYTYRWKPTEPLEYKVKASWKGDAEYKGTESVEAVLTVTSKLASKLTVTLSPTSIEVGGTVEVTGTLKEAETGVGLPSKKITIYYSEDGETWTILAEVSTDEKGGYRYSWTVEEPGLFYVKASWIGDEEYTGTEASPVTLNVAKIGTELNLEVGSQTVKVGGEITVYGSLTPPIPSAQITITYVRPDGSTVERKVEAGEDGSFSDIYRVEAEGEWQVKARWPGNEKYEASESQTKTFTAVSLKPAAFELGELKVSSTKVNTGETVEVQVTVTNTGEAEGEYTVELKVNDIVEDTKKVTLTGGESEVVTFSFTREEPGTYTVTVDGRSATVTFESPPLIDPLLIAVAVAAVVAVGAVVILRRR